MISLLVGGSFSSLTRADMKTPETNMKETWVGKDRCHTFSKLIYITHWKISDLHRTSSPSLHVVLTSLGIWLCRIFCLFVSVWYGFFCSYALGRVLEKRQPRVELKGHQKMKGWSLTVREEIEKALNIPYIFPGHLLVQTLCSRT